MTLFAQSPLAFSLMWEIGFVIVLGFLISWAFLGNLLLAGRSIWPRYEPRRPVPWKGFDILVIVLFYLLVVQGLVLVPRFLEKQPVQNENLETEPTALAPTKASDKTTEHPMAQLMKDKDATILLLCFSVGVVIVPIFEELFFRTIFTGWLISAERPWRRKWRANYGSRGVLPVHITSLIFALMHFRGESAEVPETTLVQSTLILAAVSVLTGIFAVVWLMLRSGATARDLGWDARKWKEDLGIGLTAFFASVLPIYILQIVLNRLLPKEIAPDPITLYFFAVLLGTVYFRTGRLLPSIVMHMLLNAASLGMAWAMM